METQNGLVKPQRNIIIVWLLLIFSIIASVGLGFIIVSGFNIVSNTLFAVSLDIDPINYLTALVLLLILSISLKIDYSNKLFIADIVFSIFLIGYTPFTFALFILVFLLLLQKLFKLL